MSQKSVKKAQSFILLVVATAAIAACAAQDNTDMMKAMPHVPVGEKGLQQPNGMLNNGLMPAQKPNG